MALIECRHCGKDVFKLAYFCPNCAGWTKMGYLGLCTLSAEFAIITIAAIKFILWG